jgi:hypothetical protein
MSGVHKCVGQQYKIFERKFSKEKKLQKVNVLPQLERNSENLEKKNCTQQHKAEIVILKK